MPLPGGPADKFGNRYEGLWTVKCMLDVIDELADSIRLEPPGPEGEGVEFRISQGDKRVYHQVKRQNTNGRWTLSDLGQGTVLSQFAEKLTDPNASCFFLSGNDAYQVHELSDRARSSISWEEYDSVFLRAADKKKDFEQIRGLLGGLSAVEAYLYLKRITAEAIGETILRTTVESRVSGLVDAEPGVATDVLAQFALDSVHDELTANDIWNHLETRGLHRRRWDQDPHVLAAVKDANNRYLNSIRAQVISGIVLPREETESSLEYLNSPNGNSGVLVVGDAGLGKSGVMLQIVDILLTNGTPVVAFRADRIQATQLADDIGAQLGLPGSPTNVLNAVAKGRECVLVIDQLDALSLASGRNSNVYGAIEETLRQARVHSNMRILLACRRFDLENDHRLRNLIRSDQTVDIVSVNQLSHETVREVVSSLGLDSEGLNSKQLDLLAVPLHLKLLSEITADDHIRALNFVTSHDLYERFWRHKQQVIEHERLGRPVEWTKVIDALCEYMHQHQTLTVPEVLLDEWGNDADAMTSENVLVRDSNRYSFFHEGFFDYAYARRFSASSQRLLTLLLSEVGS